MLKKSFTEEYKNPSKKIHQNNPKAQPLLAPFISLYYFVIGVGALPVRLLTRRNFGERSIPLLALILFIGTYFYYVFIVYFQVQGLQFLGVFYLLGYNTQELTPEEPFHLYIFFVILLFLNGFSVLLINVIEKAVNHFKKIKAGELNNSKSSEYRGDSFKFLHLLGTEFNTPLGIYLVDYDFLQRVVEPYKYFIGGLKIFFWATLISFFILMIKPPLLLVGLAIIILSYSGLGLMVSLSSICLFLEEQGIKQRKRDAALDIIDGEKDMKSIMELKEQILLEEDSNSNNIQSDSFPVVKIR